MKRVYSSNSEPEIAILKGLLESNDVKVLITAEGVGNYMRTLGADFNLFKDIKVQDQDFEKAKQIMEENDYVVMETSSESSIPTSVKWMVRIGLVAILAAYGYVYISQYF
jgi:hypothetical protein